MSAWLEHAPFAFWLTEIHRPASLVELGCHWGYSYMAFCQSVQGHQIAATCHAVDTWQGDEQAGFYGNEVFAAVSEHNQRKYGAFSSLIRSTFDEALGYFPDGTIDLLHIDGLHTHEAVRHDFEVWRPKLSARAIVLFHDINVRERDFGVWSMWRELSGLHPHFAFHHGHGLGVLGIGEKLSPVLKKFLSIPEESDLAGSIRQAYARLGGGVTGLKIAGENLQLQTCIQESASLFLQKSTESGKTISEKESANASLQDQKNRLEKQLTERAVETQRLATENSGLLIRKTDLERQLADQASETQLLATENSGLSARNTDLEGQINTQAAEAKRLASGNFVLQGQKALLEEQLAAHYAGMERLVKENAVLEGQKTQIKQQLAAHFAERKELQEEAFRMRTGLEQQLAASSAKKNALIEEALIARTGLEQQLAASIAEKNALIEENATLLAWSSNLEQQLATHTQEAARLADEGRKLQIQIIDLEQTIAAQAQDSALQQEHLTHQWQMTEQKRQAGLQAAEALRAVNQQQKKLIKSAQDWQKRSWVKRAFHRWRVPNDKAENITRLGRLSQGITGKSKAAAMESSSADGPATTDLLRTVFHESYYLHQYPGLAAGGMAPLEHYLSVGWREGRNPHPFFDVKWYLLEYRDVRNAGIEPLEHYLKYGWREERNPHPFFNVAWYLKHNPDVRQAGMEPLHHYLEWGCQEAGRLPNPFGDGDWFIELAKIGGPITDFEARKMLNAAVRTQPGNLNPDRQTILVVTHDSTRTGAPTIALNLISKFRRSYNVVTVSLGDGPLDEAFKSASDAFIVAPAKSYPGVQKVSTYLRFILGQCRIKFAIVNSIESVNALPALARNDIPIIHLIHEFAGYSRPADKLRKAVFLSSATIFPAKIVHENAVSVCQEIHSREALILHQGFCECPASEKTEAEVHQEKMSIKAALRPDGWEDAVVILGMGTVQMRKGVDLFFLCAEDVIKSNPGKKVRFVWAGAGFDPEKDIYFSVYLADQMQRMAAGTAACLIGEISQPQYAYELADIFFISSRMDPFPLVAQEAMRNALPVICFDKAAGTAETLSANPETRTCVIPYLDIEAAVSQIQHLIDDPQLRKHTGLQCQLLAEESFNLDHYVRDIENIALHQVSEKKREMADRDIIVKSDLLNISYLTSPTNPEIWSNPIWWYVRAWASQVNLRKPFPGFHPGIYAEEQEIIQGDPLAHYLESNQPDGPWKLPVIEPPGIESIVNPEWKTALHIHLFYPDMAAEISERLKRNKSRPDLFITVPGKEFMETAEHCFKSLNADHLEISVVPNRGRDIGAFLTGFGADVFRDYQIVGHLHTKKSLHLKNPRFVKLWSDFLLENHLGGQHPMMDAILAAMDADASLGLVYPDDPHVVTWDKNLPHGQQLCDRLGLPAIVSRHLNFPVGTFFWARTAAIQKLLDLQLAWTDYPLEPLPDDGSMLHAIERVLPSLTVHAGYKIAVTHVPGVTR